MLLDDSMPLARLHALWTLRGLSKLDKDIVKSALDDDDRIVCAALRVINWPKSEYSYLEKFIDGASPSCCSYYFSSRQGIFINIIKI